jgi:DNA-binding transcriptional regulator YiaG
MNLLELRKKLKISQMSMAKLLGTGISTYITWEKEVAKPNEENQKKIDELIKKGEQNGRNS